MLDGTSSSVGDRNDPNRPNSTTAPVISIDVFQPGLRERLPHAVQIESEHAGSKLFALAALVRFARRCGVSSFLCPVSPYDHDPVIVGNNRIAWIDSGTRTDDRNIHRTDRCLDSPFGAHAFAPNGEAHFRQDLHIAYARVDDQRSRTPRLEAGG